MIISWRGRILIEFMHISKKFNTKKFRHVSILKTCDTETIDSSHYLIFMLNINQLSSS